MNKAPKRPRIREDIYKEFQRLAIDNGTTVEVEINKALTWNLERKKCQKKN